MRTTKQYFYPNNGGFVMVTKTRRHYGFLNFLFDIFMVCITAGLWLIWIFVREMRNH